MSSKTKCLEKSCCLCVRRNTHTEKISLPLQKFVVDVSDLEEVSGQCACGVSATWTKGGVAFKLRWQAQRRVRRVFLHVP